MDKFVYNLDQYVIKPGEKCDFCDKQSVYPIDNGHIICPSIDCTCSLANIVKDIGLYPKIKEKVVTKVAIVGCRLYSNYNNIEQYLLKWEDENIRIDVVISGGARGIDTIAKNFALKHNKDYLPFEPNWDKYGVKAGLERNTDIIKACDKIIAFPSKYSRGTWDTVRKGRLYKKPVTVIKI